MKKYFIKTSDGTIYNTDNLDTWPADESTSVKMPAKEGKAEFREQKRQDLLKLIKQGDTVFTILRHCSASGMSRSISLMVIVDGKPHVIDYTAACLMDMQVNKNNRQGIVVSGCGMDMGFHLVYTLARYLFPDGTKDGGYALRHEWL